MCTVSNVYDYGQRDWNRKFNWPRDLAHKPLVPPFTPTPVPPKPPSLDEMRKWLEEFKRLVAAAEEFDRKTGQPDCEDPKKSAWMREVERRLAELEATAANIVKEQKAAYVEAHK